MRRSLLERMRARWVTGYYGHGAVFLIELTILLRMWVRWRLHRKSDSTES